MKKTLHSATIRWFILLILAVVIASDIFFYYRDTAQAEPSREPLTSPLVESEKNTILSPLLEKPDSQPTFQVTSFELIETAPAARIATAQQSFIGTSLPTDISSVAVYKLSYNITGKNGAWQPVTAQVYIPESNKPVPLYVFGSGTTGMADKCAPSLENVAVENLGNYHNHMIAQAAEGYVTIFPDYEGFHSQETQAYFVSQSEASTLLGALKSLKQLESTTTALQNTDFSLIFLGGYSQGGHAALSSAQRWEELEWDPQLVGVIEFAGAADVQALFIESPWLASYLVESYIEYYGSNLQAFAVLQDNWLQQMTKNNQELCVNQANKFYPHDPNRIYTPQFIDAVTTDIWPSTLENWQAVIDENIPHNNLPPVHYLSVQGETDPIVTAQTQKRNVEKLCQQGKSVEYKEFPGINHYDIRKAGFIYSNDWMSDRLAHIPVTQSCTY